jgi:hypothetical protein
MRRSPIDPEARERAARPQHAQARLEGRLQPERLDRDVNAAPVGQTEDVVDRVGLAEIDDLVRAEPLRHREPLRHAVDRE